MNVQMLVKYLKGKHAEIFHIHWCDVVEDIIMSWLYRNSAASLSGLIEDSGLSHYVFTGSDYRCGLTLDRSELNKQRPTDQSLFISAYDVSMLTANVRSDCKRLTAAVSVRFSGNRSR